MIILAGWPALNTKDSDIVFTFVVIKEVDTFTF